MKTKIQSLSDLAGMFPPNAEVLYVYGLELVDRSLWEQAVEAFDEAVGAKPKCYQSRYWAAKAMTLGGTRADDRAESLGTARKLALKANDDIAVSEIDALLAEILARD